VVVVNYRQWPDTGRLVRQVLDTQVAGQGGAEVVIVDNHSPPHRVVTRLRRAPGVSLRRWGRNRGFARAANEGCRLSRGGWLLLLNPDTTLPPGFLGGVLALAERWEREQPRAGIVGLGLRNPDGSRQLSDGPFPTLLGSLARLLLPRRWRKYSLLPGNPGGPVAWVTGCCLLVRRDCWADLGGFDPDFFLYYEDVDLCRRAWQRGWSVCYEPGLNLVHHHPLHGREVAPHIRLFTRHALLTYAGKHWPAWQFRLLTALVGAEANLRALLASRRADTPAAEVFRRLKFVTQLLAAGRRGAARRQLLEVARQQEERCDLAAVGRHPEPQPSGPAVALPRRREPARPARHGSGRC
jgi:GT2 family glycosyltransferase